MAPYCNKMLLAPDYGERAKGSHRHPKPKFHITALAKRPCEQFHKQHPDGYKVPHSSTREPLPNGRALDLQAREVMGGNIARPVPKDPERPGPP